MAIMNPERRNAPSDVQTLKQRKMIELEEPVSLESLVPARMMDVPFGAFTGVY